MKDLYAITDKHELYGRWYMFDNLKELIEKNEQAFKVAEKEFRDNYLILMKEKHKSEEVGDLNGRDLYHGAMK